MFLCMNKKQSVSQSHINLCFGKVAPVAYHSTLHYNIRPMSKDRLYFLYASQMMWYYSSQEWNGSATWISIKAGLLRWMRGEGTRHNWACNPSLRLHRTVQSVSKVMRAHFWMQALPWYYSSWKSHPHLLLQKQARLKCLDNLLNFHDRLNCRTLMCQL